MRVPAEGGEARVFKLLRRVSRDPSHVLAQPLLAIIRSRRPSCVRRAPERRPASTRRRTRSTTSPA